MLKNECDRPQLCVEERERGRRARASEREKEQYQSESTQLIHLTARSRLVAQLLARSANVQRGHSDRGRPVPDFDPAAHGARRALGSECRGPLRVTSSLIAACPTKICDHAICHVKPITRRILFAVRRRILAALGVVKTVTRNKTRAGCYRATCRLTARDALFVWHLPARLVQHEAIVMDERLPAAVALIVHAKSARCERGIQLAFGRQGRLHDVA